ncbi:MAG: hypothetical protein QM727_00050 [Niabella sp.]
MHRPIFSKTYFMTSEEVGKAVINVTLNGYDKNVLEVKDISKLAKSKSG